MIDVGQGDSTGSLPDPLKRMVHTDVDNWFDRKSLSADDPVFLGGNDRNRLSRAD